jgi:hypothetical protein
VLTLEKVTTAYNSQEDRIRFSAEASDNSVITLWATRRMLVMLIPPVSEWLDEKKKYFVSNGRKIKRANE